MKVCDKTCIFCFFPIINKYLCMAKRSLLSRCPSYIYISLLKSVQTGSGAYPDSRSKGTGVLLGVKRPGHEVHHSPYQVPMKRISGAIPSTVTACLQGVDRDNFTFC